MATCSNSAVLSGCPRPTGVTLAAERTRSIPTLDWIGIVSLSGIAVSINWWVVKSYTDRMERRFDLQDARLERRFDQRDARLERRFDQRDTRLDERFDHLDKRFDQQDKRFDLQDARFDKRFDLQDARFDKRFDLQDARFDKRFDLQDARFGKRFDQQDGRFDRHETRLERLESLMLRLVADVGLLMGAMGIYPTAKAKVSSGE